MSLTDRERAIVETIDQTRDELIALLFDLIGFDTLARDAGQPPRDEAALQHYLAGRLGALGARTEVWEPAPEEVAGYRLIPSGLGFEGRPQMLARFVGSGGGRSLLLNGHIDVVSAEPRERWTSDPHRADVRQGKLYGRGACDMKGGIACMVFAAETLARRGIQLAGDLLICTVTDEESTGAGRPGHAGFPQPHWSEGGAVNAIEKMQIVMDAMQRLQSEWRQHPSHRHPLLSPGDIVPVQIQGGEWAVSYPSSCRLTYHVAYLPGHADEGGWGSAVEREICDWIERAAQTDSWLTLHPPTIEWAPDVPSAEVSAEEPIVAMVLQAASDVGRPGRIAGMDNWHDGATFTRLGGTPSICFGPGDTRLAHAIDEYVPIDSLVGCAQAIALAALRFSGDAQ